MFRWLPAQHVEFVFIAVRKPELPRLGCDIIHSVNTCPTCQGSSRKPPVTRQCVYFFLSQKHSPCSPIAYELRVYPEHYQNHQLYFGTS